jgi:GT2 family glycosyltransferase
VDAISDRPLLGPGQALDAGMSGGASGQSRRVAGNVRPRLSVVIVTWNVGGFIGDCIESVLRSDLGGVLEVIVVDNNSSDDTTRIVRNRYPEVRLLAQSANLGFPVANNIGIRSATSDLILLLNPDTVVAPDALRLSVDAADRNRAVGIIGCRLVYPDGALQYECARRLPALMDPIVETFYLHVLFPGSRVFGRHLMSYWDHGSDQSVECISGAFMLLRRRMIDSVGLLDDRFFMYYEDLEYCARARRAGWEVFYCSEAVVTHHSGVSRRQSRVPFDYLVPDIRYTYFRDYRGRLTAELYRTLAGGQAIVRLCASVVVRLFLPKARSESFATAGRPGVHLRQLLWCLGFRSWRGLGRRARSDEMESVAP